MRRLYLDHNATTPVRPQVRDILLATMDRLGGNPSSVHASGREARDLLDQARERVAGALGVLEDEVIFTSGGTESDNLALQGVLLRSKPGARLVTTAIEHSAVLRPAEELRAQGFEVQVVGVDSDGEVDAEALLEAAQGAALVSVMAANNELGNGTDLSHLCEQLRERYGDARPVIHTDAVQVLGKRPLDLAQWGIDLASFSAHKIGGPLGCGILVRRMGTLLRPVTFGGGQEADLRPGTENVPAIVASSHAIELAVQEQAAFAEHTGTLVNMLWSRLRQALPDVRLLGQDLDHPLRLPNTINLLIDGIDGRAWVARLDMEGLEASAGSACASGSLEPSHVLLALGLSREQARTGLRLSLGRSTKAEDIHKAVDIVGKTAANARKS